MLTRILTVNNLKQIALNQYKYCLVKSKRQENDISYLFLYFPPLGRLFPLPPPEGLPVVLGALTGLVPFAILNELIGECLLYMLLGNPHLSFFDGL